MNNPGFASNSFKRVSTQFSHFDFNHSVTYRVYKKRKLDLNINSKEHKQSLLRIYTPIESPTIQLSNNG